MSFLLPYGTCLLRYTFCNIWRWSERPWIHICKLNIKWRTNLSTIAHTKSGYVGPGWRWRGGGGVLDKAMFFSHTPLFWQQFRTSMEAKIVQLTKRYIRVWFEANVLFLLLFSSKIVPTLSPLVPVLEHVPLSRILLKLNLYFPVHSYADLHVNHLFIVHFAV